MKYDNPFIISKDIAPYLYLTEYSGIYLNEYDSNINRYVSIPINPELSNNHYLLSTQFWIRFPNETFSASATVLEIVGPSASVVINCVPETGGKRGILKIDSEYACWQNGQVVNNPVINPFEWHAINVSFPSFLNFSNEEGSLKIHKSFVFNNIELYSFNGPPSILHDYENHYKLDGSKIYDQKVGTSLISIEDSGGVAIYTNGMDILTDVVWEKFDKNAI